MRYWNPLSDPNKPVARSRSVLYTPSKQAPSQFGQRPMFSVPGPDQPPPTEGRLGSEARLHGLEPTDESSGSESRTELVIDEARAGVMLTYTNTNVASPPTAAELTESFGQRPAGFMAFVIDNGGSGQVWLCIKSKNDLWWYQQFTKAV